MKYSVQAILADIGNFLKTCRSIGVEVLLHSSSRDSLVSRVIALTSDRVLSEINTNQLTSFKGARFGFHGEVFGESMPGDLRLEFRLDKNVAFFQEFREIIEITGDFAEQIGTHFKPWEVEEKSSVLYEVRHSPQWCIANFDKLVNIMESISELPLVVFKYINGGVQAAPLRSCTYSYDAETGVLVIVGPHTGARIGTEGWLSTTRVATISDASGFTPLWSFGHDFSFTLLERREFNT